MNETTEDMAIPMGEVLKGAEARAQIEAFATEIGMTAAAEATASRKQVALVYNTETTEAARTLIGQVDRLNRLIKEDDDELAHLADEYSRQVDELERRYEEERAALMEASEEAGAHIRERRADRERARRAFQAVIDGLQQRHG
jgi:hypothetical protein